MAFSFGTKYTRKKFDIGDADELKKLPFLSLKEMYNGVDNDGADIPFDGKGGETFVIRGIYINGKSRYGAAPLCVIDGAKVNFPRHMLQMCNEILSDADAIAAINAGQAGFTIYEYTDNNYGRLCYGVNFCDVIPARPRRHNKANAEQETEAGKPRKKKADGAEDGDLPF